MSAQTFRGRPVRHFEPPHSLGGKLRAYRYVLLRRLVQVGTLVLFFATAHWGLSVLGRPLLQGNLSASEVLGAVPLADPFAALQIFLTRHVLEAEVLLGAALVLAVYAVLGGRVWCAWVCPVNMVTDAAAWLRRRLGVHDAFTLSRKVRYWVLGLALVLSAATGLAAFEWVSPIGIVHREVLYGLGLGWMAVLGIFLLDLLVLRHGWCGHLCPLGAFYAAVGGVAQVRVAFDDATCTRCGDCARVCPEPQVIRPALKGEEQGRGPVILSGECTNCGRCIDICPQDVFNMGTRYHNVPPDAERDVPRKAASAR